MSANEPGSARGGAAAARRRLRSLLFVTNAPPPEDFAGTPRIAKTVKYLLRSGVRCRILAPHPRAGHHDASLLPDLAGAEVVRTPRLHPGPLVELLKRLLPRRRPGAAGGAAEPGGGAAGLYNRLHALLFIPDESIGWLPFALPAGARMIAAERPDLILSTGPDHACHLLASLLARRHRLPHVAEFRDPWVGNPLRLVPTPLHAALDRALERFVLAGAAGVVTIGETMSAAYRARARCPVETIYNGYDEEEVKAGVPPLHPAGVTDPGPRVPFRPADSPPSRGIGGAKGDTGGLEGPRPSSGGRGVEPHALPLVAHAGTFYAGRSPRPFLEALARTRAARALFLGPGAEAILALARDLRVADLVEAPGPVPRAECLARLRGADALLLIPGPGAGTITGKVFEYLALGRPILALAGPDQEVARILAGHPAHAVAPPEDPAAVDAALIRCLRSRSAPARPDRRYSRAYQTERLRRFLEALLP